MATPAPKHALFGSIVMLALAAAGCGAGVTRDQIERSEREYQLGVGLWGESNAPGAFEHLLRAIELDPDNAEAHHFLGNLFWIVRRDFARAEQHFREALRANEVAPGPAGLAADVKNSLGVLYVNAGRHEDAIAVLREAASDLMNRQPALSWANLGWAYHEGGQNEPALEALNQAVQIAPTLCLAWYRLGQVRAAREEWEPAIPVARSRAGGRGRDVRSPAGRLAPARGDPRAARAPGGGAPRSRALRGIVLGYGRRAGLSAAAGGLAGPEFARVSHALGGYKPQSGVARSIPRSMARKTC
ncbi:MAG: tetratricopeptide repeat protein [Sandaracinaceae bacterium]|nr:tetratricopeptide repeat protein [Sandaracinaceae bacterium]